MRDYILNIGIKIIFNILLSFLKTKKYLSIKEYVEIEHKRIELEDAIYRMNSGNIP